MAKIRLVPSEKNPNRFSVVHQESRETPDHLAPVEPTNYSITTGSHHDRARAFTLRTLSLSLVAGLFTVIAAIVLFSVPAFSFMALMALAGGFFLVWIVAYLADMIFSAEGIQLINSVFFWRHMAREQKHDHYIEVDKWIERQ